MGREGCERQSARDRRRLVRDFERRLAHAEPSSVLVRPSSTAIVIHPTWDEYQPVRERAASGAGGIAVDAHWRYGDSTYFVEVWGTRMTPRNPGIYYYFDEPDRQDRFQVVLERPVVTSEGLGCAFAALEVLISSGLVESARAAISEHPDRIAGPP